MDAWREQVWIKKVPGSIVPSTLLKMYEISRHRYPLPDSPKAYARTRFLLYMIYNASSNAIILDLIFGLWWLGMFSNMLEIFEERELLVCEHAIWWRLRIFHNMAEKISGFGVILIHIPNNPLKPVDIKWILSINLTCFDRLTEVILHRNSIYPLGIILFHILIQVHESGLQSASCVFPYFDNFLVNHLCLSHWKKVERCMYQEPLMIKERYECWLLIHFLDFL